MDSYPIQWGVVIRPAACFSDIYLLRAAATVRLWPRKLSMASECNFAFFPFSCRFKFIYIQVALYLILKARVSVKVFIQK